MPLPTRRSFLAQATAGAAASALLSSAKLRAAGANQRVRLGLVGCGNQGKAHQKALATLEDAELVYVCDVDNSRVEEAVARTGAKPVTDLRRIFDDASIDGVIFAVPDHWHVPGALLALEAGKHVYVEKPCSYNFREGQLLGEAVRKHKKVFQHGTQSRSSRGMQQAIGLLHEGLIGDVLIAKCWNWQKRKNIGHLSPSEPPPGVDYDTWVGPAQWLPFQANRFHYNWHWWYDFGAGGMGNDAVHELDYALWGLGVTEHPSTITGLGGIYYFDDDRQWPDTQQVTFEYPGNGSLGAKRMLIYEQRLWSTSYPYNVDSGAEYYGTKGKMFLSKRGKIEAFDGSKKRIKLPIEPSSVKPTVADNEQNWMDCIRSGEVTNAPIEAALRTATAIHLGNISTRLERTLRFDIQKEQIIGDDQATAMLTRKYRKEGHWAVPGAV